MRYIRNAFLYEPVGLPHRKEACTHRIAAEEYAIEHKPEVEHAELRTM